LGEKKGGKKGFKWIRNGATGVRVNFDSQRKKKTVEPSNRRHGNKAQEKRGGITKGRKKKGGKKGGAKISGKRKSGSPNTKQRRKGQKTKKKD